ncbi:MAG TPA: hypothetical protein VK057_13195 [Bacillota bacterium]|uniref:hypothetical protein n=1 Tax=Compostibacillus humi TaxID=1245525 RepID=UPI00166565C7|nr:hypothetical protein [Compostibacillus humi]HLT57052.1 hypothetical protein [Bacillota bacterium]
MHPLFQILFFLFFVIAFCLNILGLMRIIPLYVTLPMLFISIYLALYSLFYQKPYRKRMR